MGNDIRYHTNLRNRRSRSDDLAVVAKNDIITRATFDKGVTAAAGDNYVVIGIATDRIGTALEGHIDGNHFGIGNPTVVPEDSILAGAAKNGVVLIATDNRVVTGPGINIGIMARIRIVCGAFYL